MTEEHLKTAYLFAVKPRAIRREGALGNYRLYGDAFPTTANEPNGLLIYYYLNQDAAQPVSLTVTDTSGKVVRTLQGPSHALAPRRLRRRGDPAVAAGEVRHAHPCPRENTWSPSRQGRPA
jgi:hypothetical protein